VVTIGLYYQVRPGKEQVFEQTADRVMELLAANPGHLKSFLYRDVKNPLSYAILSEWNSSGAFGAFLNSEAFKQIAEFGRSQVLQERPRHRVYGAERELGAADTEAPS